MSLSLQSATRSIPSHSDVHLQGDVAAVRSRSSRKSMLEPDRTRDLIFSAAREVVLLDGQLDFLVIPSEDPRISVYLAGSCLDAVDLSSVSREEVADLYGQFVLVTFNRGTKTLSLCSDRFGLQPLYSASRGRRLYFSTRVTTLLRRGVIDCELDFAAMSEIVACNTPIDQRTPWKNVASFAGATEVIVDLNSLNTRVRKLWRPDDLLRTADVPISSAIKDLTNLFLESIAKTTLP